MRRPAAETLADQYGLSRDECDRYAAASQNRAEAARSTGRFDAEIAPVRIETARRGEGEVGSDEHPRDGVTPESLAKLRPVFRKDGVVHAGNSSGITDGAAAVVLRFSLVVLSADRAAELGVRPMARLVGYATAGVDPRVMGIGPVPAVRDLLARTGESLDNVALVELNEAFAPQVLACARDLDLDPERLNDTGLNVNGGAIALGHPIGATGARIVVTLLHEMERRDVRYGIATLCVSGGMGVAVQAGALSGLPAAPGAVVG